MTKLEEIARAICKASGQSWRTGTFTALTGTDTVANKMTWEEHDLDLQNNQWRYLARAAVEAMREPTDDMRRAFWDAEDATDTGFKRAWAAAIDAILSEAKQEEG